MFDLPTVYSIQGALSERRIEEKTDWNMEDWREEQQNGLGLLKNEFSSSNRSIVMLTKISQTQEISGTVDKARQCAETGGWGLLGCYQRASPFH